MIEKVLTLMLCLISVSVQAILDPDEGVRTAQLIRSKGYLAEEHDVVTKDGYILTIQRIINRNESSKPKQVAFLQHGLLDASSTWVVNFPAQSLGFILAENYDVWLGNVRGNTYAENHIKYNKNQEQFWDFSFDEMAQYDIPAMIDYILALTKQTKLFYIGHSQGTMVAFARLSTDYNLASKIKLFLALGPVSTVGNMVSPIKYLAQIGAESKQQIWYELFGKRDFFPSNTLVKILAEQLCDKVTINKVFCENILFVLCGPSENLNATRIPVYFTHAPAGTSTKNLVHFAQMVINKNFQMYDYGTDNMAHYNQSTAPVYNIKNVQVPVALYYGEQDWLADQTDVEYLRANLPMIVDDFKINNWNHLDFVWASNATQAFYNRMVKLMLKFN